MADASNAEQHMLGRLTAERPARKVVALEGTAWGHLILPAPEEAAASRPPGLKVLAIGSWTLGLMAFDALAASSDVTLVGLVTDDPLDSGARISMKRRFWRYYSEDEREKYEWGLLHRALDLGLPCFTGDVKCDAFRGLLAAWAPEAIVVAGFGQIIDAPIIEFPPFGIYNVHPSDLVGGHGAGPQPWEDVVARKAGVTRVSVIRVSPELDAGGVVGQSPEINVSLPDGSPCEDVRLIMERTLSTVGPLVAQLILALSQRKAAGMSGPIERLDLEHRVSPSLVAALKTPLDPAARGRILPLAADEAQFMV